MSIGTSRPASASIRVLGALIVCYALAGAAAFAALCVLDAALRAQGPWVWLVYAAALGCAAGALSGSGLALALALLGRLGRRLRIVLVVAVGVGFASYTVRALGVLVRLSVRDGALVCAAVTGILLLYACLALLALALASRGLGSFEAAQDSWLARATRRQRLALLALLLLGATTALIADAYVWVDEYSFMHHVLRTSVRIAFTAALAQLTLRLGTRARVALTSAAAAFVVLALLALSSDKTGALITLDNAPLVGLALTELRDLGDVDADGFAPWLGGEDCAAFDPNVHPGAQELPGNGIDDNCRMGDLPLVSARSRERNTLHAKEAAPSVVLITIDTLRADHVGLYGYPRATTPHIDAFFAAGTRYADAVAPGACTTISMPALMHGLYARHLAWQATLQTDHFRLLPTWQATQLQPGEAPMNAHLIAHDAEHPSLAQRLNAIGYRTLAVVDDGGSGFLSRAILGAGFEQYLSVSDEATALSDPLGDARVADAALEQLQTAGPRPFLLWLHFYGAHSPDARHTDVPRFGESLIDRYDHEIASLDRQLGRVLEALTALQENRPILTLLTADHGESFYAFGRAHGLTVSDDEILVPLLARGPGFAHETLPQSVSLVDIVPTVITLVAEHTPEDLDGVSLLPPLQPMAAARPVLSDIWRYDARGRIETARVAAVSGNYRVELNLLTNTLSAFRRPNQSMLASPPLLLENAVFTYLEQARAQPDTLFE